MKRIMRLKDDKMELVANKHLEMVKSFDGDASGKRHNQLYFLFFPIIEGIDYKKHTCRWARKGDIDVTSVGDINFSTQVIHNFETTGRSLVLFHFHLERFMVMMRDESVKFFNGATEITKAEYLKRMKKAMTNHFAHVKTERNKKILARMCDAENQKEWVKNDGGLKMALDNKEIVPKTKMTGPCVLVALAIATETKISNWYDILTAMKMREGYRKDACSSNYEHHYNPLLRERGFVYKKGDKRALKYSNLPKTGTVFVDLKGHACVVKDNVVQDRWDCRRRKVLGYWVKQ